MENERYEKEDLDRATEVLRNGGIILYPTDTVWGIGCDAANAEAVEKIYRLKQRADSKAMLCLVDSEGMLQRSVLNVPDTAWQLIEAAVNPLTLIYDRPTGVADNLKADDGSLGIRISSEPFSSALCRRLRGPIVSTSANVSGKKTPRRFADIEQEIIDGVDYVVKYGRISSGTPKPSNIIKVSDNGVIKVIR